MFLHKVFRSNQNRAICLPQTLSREFGINYGDYVTVEATKTGILIRKVQRTFDEIRVASVGYDPRAKT